MVQDMTPGLFLSQVPQTLYRVGREHDLLMVGFWNWQLCPDFPSHVVFF